MKGKLLNLALILTSLLGYLAWGPDQKMFLWQGELEVLAKLFTDPVSALHPFTLLPLIGQVLLGITLFQQRPSRLLTFVGIAGIGLLLGFMLVIGVMGGNLKIALSTLPFLLTAFFTIRHQLAARPEESPA